MAERSIAEQYVDAVNVQDEKALMALFADEAVLLHPVGEFTGGTAISGFYRDIVFLGQAHTTIVKLQAISDGELALIEAKSPLDPDAGTVHAADIFTVADGVIVRLEIYYR
jgi:ketosteroid isomerase-like protein